MQAILDGVMAICRDAGDAILEVYDREDFDVETKQDESPLTAADLASHKTILAGLADLAPEIPVLSEESDALPWSERQHWDRYFLIDPLDGTKEFISRNGEFTVNVALIENHVPVMGIVYVPVKDILYGGVGAGEALAFVERDGRHEQIRTRPLDSNRLTIVASRRHGGDALKACLERLETHFPEIETRNMGSSLKLCLVAEGEADLYPRLAPTSEWDTAAAQAVVEAAGGRVVDTAFDTVRYNAKEDILNPHFYVLGDPGFDWQRILG